MCHLPSIGLYTQNARSSNNCQNHCHQSSLMVVIQKDLDSGHLSVYTHKMQGRRIVVKTIVTRAAWWLSSKKLSKCMAFGFSLYIVKVDLPNEAKCIQPYTYFSECNIQSGWESAKIFWVFKECHFETVPPTKPYNTVKDGSHNWGVSAHHIY